MDRQNPHLIIEWDLTGDPEFSIHKALVGGIYAAHDPLTGFLGSVFKKIVGGVTKVVSGVTNAVTKIASSPIGKLVMGIGGTLLSGGALGPALLAGGLNMVGLPGQQIIAKAGGVVAMVNKYCGAIGAVLPQGLSSSLSSAWNTVTSTVAGPFKSLYEQYAPLIKGWADTFTPALERVQGVLKPFAEMIPGDVGMAGLGQAWADKRITGEFMTDILKAPPEFGLMTDPSLTNYLDEIHKLGRIVPPVPPISMPQLNLQHLGPEVHQFWKGVTGIPKIIPTLEGVWNSIKDVWATIKDSMIFIANWLKITFQETLNLIQITLKDITIFLSTGINALTVKIWESMREMAREILGGFASLGEKIFQGISYVTDLFRDQLAELWKFVGNLPVYIWEFLQPVVASLFQGINATRAWLFERISDLGGLVTKQATWIKEVVVSFFTSYLPSLFQWLWDQIKALGTWVTDVAVPTVLREGKGAWMHVEEYFKNYTHMAYSATESHLRSYTPMTPDKAPMAAAGLLGIAIAFGMGAHTLSMATELVHPLKTMGVHYLSGFMANMGSFGTIASSTMGILVAYSLRRPMGYYVNSIFRPTQPAAMDLMMMAVKPDISMEEFRRGMSYEGYSEGWIDRFQATMYNEPRHFELGFMGEDQTADAPWLYTKARRAGYCPEDAEIFTRGLIAKIIRTRKEELYRHAFNSYKEGYLGKNQFIAYLDGLQMRPEAKFYAVISADLAYRFDYISDMLGLLTSNYLADLIDDDDLRVAIAALGIEERKASLIFNKARIRKLPKIMRAEKKEAQAVIREAQKKYQDLYRTLYRTGRISEVQYQGYLVALGMTPEMAELTVALEAARTYEPPEDVQVREQEKLAKKVQDEQVKKYRELYRRGQIDFLTLVGYFIMAGVDPDLAIAMAETEQAKTIPKPKTTEVITT